MQSEVAKIVNLLKHMASKEFNAMAYGEDHVTVGIYPTSPGAAGTVTAWAEGDAVHAGVSFHAMGDEVPTDYTRVFIFDDEFNPIDLAELVLFTLRNGKRDAVAA